MTDEEREALWLYLRTGASGAVDVPGTRAIARVATRCTSSRGF